MSAELLSDWGPLVALAGLLWRWTVNMDKRLARFEANTGASGWMHWKPGWARSNSGWRGSKA